jgi:3-methyladenine DNA glycosylase AlkD
MEFQTIVWNDESYRQLVAYLKENADEAYRVFNSRIVKSTVPMLGVRMPILQKTARQIAKGDYERYFTLPHGNYFEETMLEGLVISALKLPYSKLYPLVGSFVDKIENWMVCDCFCNALKSVKRFPEEFWEYISFLLRSNNPWHIRTGLVLMLDYFLDEDHISEVFSRCDAVTNPHYYVQMAQAWLVSMAYVKFPAITDEYLSHCKLDDFTYNKALTKACESRCATDAQRKHLRSLKRV